MASLFPWDVLGDPALSARLRSAGISRVSLAAAYHGVRAATPQHPQHRLVDAEHSAFYVPVRDRVWGGAELAPSAPGRWSPSDAFPRAVDVLVKEGIDVEAWLVLNHSTAVGTVSPRQTVRSAFGDRYRYALCPSWPEVNDYARRLVAETIAAVPVVGVSLEAAGQLGVTHLGLHEKTAGADWSEEDRLLLSICFCEACAAAYREAGQDPEALAERVRGSVGRDMDPVAVLGEAAGAVLNARTAAVRALSTTVAGEVRTAGTASLTFHATTDTWATGAFAPLAQLTSDHDALLFDARELSLLGADGIEAVRGGVGSRILLSANIAAGTPNDAVALVRRARRLPVDGIQIGHVGLIGRQRHDLVVDALTNES